MPEDTRPKITRRDVLEGSALLAVASVPLAPGQTPLVERPLQIPLQPTSTGPLFVSFTAGRSGVWKIDSINRIAGESLPAAERLSMLESHANQKPPSDVWTLSGVTSNLRYTTGAEVAALKSKQQGLGRPAATRAALIPIRKSDAWWALPQDQRRSIIEEQSHHIAIGMEYLPQIARRLHHSREIGEPFDFLTWFEYAPESSEAFEKLVNRLRATKEWSYVDRELDVRLSRV